MILADVYVWTALRVRITTLYHKNKVQPVLMETVNHR